MQLYLIELVDENLKRVLDEAVFDEKTESIFKLRYGIDCLRLDPKAISKEMKIPMKKLKLELTKIDNRVFNILKKYDLFEEEKLLQAETE
ncbi:MAG: hypothetical protein BGO41_05670 [Clostridiales bacterium 38-18]|nr:MAG: hypothetical protein BGO41_05670 [Clostridiales bacterium 38-18]